MDSAFKPKDFARLSQIINETTGNKILEKNHAMVESRLKTRMIKLGIPHIEAYWDYFKSNESVERTAIQSLMTTHYTFFFREYVHFENLGSWIDANIDAIRQRCKSRKLRVWSAACSRGQEALSLAMFLHENLLTKYGVSFEVYGTDIDTESVEYATNAVYPIKEVNTIPQHYLSKHWKKGTGSVEGFAAANKELRSFTKFEKMNLLDHKDISSKGSFDVIFARNVFIYFTEEDVRKIATSLKSTMTDLSFFASGLSEPLRFEGWTLSSIGPSCYENRPIPSKPLESASNAKPVMTIATQLPVRSEPKTYRVLCVDDSTTIQLLIKKIFSTDPLCKEVAVANHGQEARQKLDASTFDLVTLDIHMPLMSGIEFLEKSFKKDRDPPILMISSVNRTDIDLAMKAISLGAFDYVEKPAMNNLQKSSDEILAKAKIALKTRNSSSSYTKGDTTFQKSISKKILINDISNSLRWIRTSRWQSSNLRTILSGLMREESSPPLIISLPRLDFDQVESELTNFFTKKVQKPLAPQAFYMPNTVYLVAADQELIFTQNFKNYLVSLQIIDDLSLDLTPFESIRNIQILVSEVISDKRDVLIAGTHLRISDITPATSFVSLSVEYFGKLRDGDLAA